MDELTHRKYQEIHFDEKNSSENDCFSIILVSFLSFFLLIGLYLHTKKKPLEQVKTDSSKLATHFVFDKVQKDEISIIPQETSVLEHKQKQKTEPQKVTTSPKTNKQHDLTSNPIHSQHGDDIVEKNETDVDKKTVRRVYGVKKVYSKGIGVTGDANDAIVGKRGNTLETEADTFTVTNEELEGKLVSISSVTSYPKLKFQVKPEYTKEMLEKKIEGVIRTKILIDTDGKVKKVIVLNNLGYGSSRKVHEACLKLEFKPALVGQTAVAVWYLIRFRFEILNN